MIAPGDLEALLPAHLVVQRWFGSGHQRPGGIRVLSQEVLRPPWPGLVRVVVGSEGNRYQLLLGLRPVDDWGAEQVGEGAILGEVGLTDGRRALCYDAVADGELAIGLLNDLAPDVEVTTVRPVMAEQSNTSLVYDERIIFKLFRRLSGSSTDVEITTALARSGFAQVAEPVAVWRIDPDDCGFAQRFLAGGAEGWALALTSLRDFLAAPVAPEEAGGDFAPEAARLGTLTAELHLALGEAFGIEAGDAAGWAKAMEASMLPVSHADLDEAGIHAVLDHLAGVSDAGVAIRVHGDYHLGQVLRTDEGWFVVDFEGEPLRSEDERRLRSSPLRDVAGMLRSLQYAALLAAQDQGGSVEAAEAWELHNRRAFVDGYFERMAGSNLLPADPVSTAAVLAAYELQKAVYEVTYEQAHRPDWVAIPLAGARRLVAERG